MPICQEKLINASLQSINLSNLPVGTSALVIDVPEHPLLFSLGLRPGKMVQARGFQLFGGPLMVKTGERQVAIGKLIADKIIVNVI
jgi:Fe2+ transport system protein FeoA